MDQEAEATIYIPIARIRRDVDEGCCNLPGLRNGEAEMQQRPFEMIDALHRPSLTIRIPQISDRELPWC